MSETEIHLPCYPEEKARLRERAAHNGFSMSEYLRHLIEWEERYALRKRICPAKDVGTMNVR